MQPQVFTFNVKDAVKVVNNVGWADANAGQVDSNDGWGNANPGSGNANAGPVDVNGWGDTNTGWDNDNPGSGNDNAGWVDTNAGRNDDQPVVTNNEEWTYDQRNIQNNNNVDTNAGWDGNNAVANVQPDYNWDATNNNAGPTNDWNGQGMFFLLSLYFIEFWPINLIVLLLMYVLPGPSMLSLGALFKHTKKVHMILSVCFQFSCHHSYNFQIITMDGMLIMYKA